MNNDTTLKSSDLSRNGSALTYMPAVDALRGIAILMVLLHHLTPVVSGSRFTRRMLETIHVGWIGVDMFFVLSGFLITAILLKTRDSENYFLNFYARRTLRIFPVYYLTLALLLLALPVLMRLPALNQFFNANFGRTTCDLPAMMEGQNWLWLYASNIKIALDGVRWGTVNHFWSLAVEEHFYLVWPLVVWFVSSRAKLIKLCLVCIFGAPLLRGGLMLAGADSVVPYVLTPCRVDSLAMGALVSILIMQPEAIAKWLPRFRWLAIGAALGLLGFAVLYRRFNRDDLMTTTFGYSLLALVSAWMVLSASQIKPGTWRCKILANPVLTSLGKYSYGIYVTHMFFAGVFAKLFSWTMLHRWTGAYWSAIVVNAVLSVLCAWGIAWLSYHAVEKHFLRLKGFFDYRKAPRPVAATDPASDPAIALPAARSLRQAA